MEQVIDSRPLIREFQNHGDVTNVLYEDAGHLGAVQIGSGDGGLWPLQYGHGFGKTLDSLDIYAVDQESNRLLRIRLAGSARVITDLITTLREQPGARCSKNVLWLHGVSPEDRDAVVNNVRSRAQRMGAYVAMQRTSLKSGDIGLELLHTPAFSLAALLNALRADGVGYDLSVQSGELEARGGKTRQNA